MSLTLEELVDNERTDKNTVNSFLPVYQKLFVGKKETAKNILEIGIEKGGSIKLWSDYFKNATIHGVDMMNLNNVWDGIKNKENIKLYTTANAYNEYVVFFIKSQNVKFDIILDDGPHALGSMIHFIRFYIPLMTDDGIFIIENIQDWAWIDVLKNEVPDDLKKYIKVYDLRTNKNRFDDILFVIDKFNV